MKGDLTYCSILGTNINVTNMKDTIHYLSDNLDELRGQYVCVSNVHTTVMAYRNENYQKVQNSAAMALPDGQPLSIVSRQRGYSQARRVPGPDLMPAMIRYGIKKGYRHYFYGSSDATLLKLRTRLEEEFTGITIAGMYAPPFRKLSQTEDADVIARINASHPDFIWVALGAPKQENWMYEHRGKLDGVMLGVGAAFDFMAGTVKRAPDWMQRGCLEWLYRIGQDPGRLIPRYISTNFAFVRLVMKEDVRGRARERSNGRAGGRPLRIAMIGHKRIPSREGGVEMVVCELATRMAAKGHKVTAYNRYGHHISGKKYDDDYGTGDRKFYKGVRIQVIPTFRSSKLNAIVYSVLATIKASFSDYDVYHFHAEGPCVMLWLPRLMHKRIIVTVHGLDWQRAKWGNFASKVILCGEKQAVRNADEIIVLSHNVQKYFMDTYGRKTVYIPNGITRPAPVSAKMITERFGLTEKGYFLFLARLVPEKGIHYLIKAYKEVKTDKKLVIAGGASQAADYMEQIHKMAEKDKRVIFTDFVQGQMLEELYSNAYAFVLPSDVEGMSVSLLEAMSYGNCCVVSDIPENTEVVTDHAVTFRHGDTEDLREKLQMLADEPDKENEYRTASADYICRRYNWDEVVDRTLEVYKG
jgi:exopolysaccharide biosynthesis WecB/TagA/CpsF family protein